jgi:predicted nucleotidyltransferase
MAANMDDLDLAGMPALPQRETIALLAPRLWRDERVRAIWIGGSLARGEGDRYSDIDLRVAVAPSDLAAWETPDFASLLDDLVLGKQFLRFGTSSFLHHLILRNSDILDFLVQSTEHVPSTEPVLLLGCRDDGLARALAANDRAPEEQDDQPVGPEAVRELLVTFWINSHKHRKVFYRDLDLMFPAGTYANWTMLMRLWYIQATGRDVRPDHFSGIHGLTELVRAVERVEGTSPLALCGLPTRNRGEICEAIERHREVAARVGRALAERFGFAYPADLEEMVLRAWEAFKAAEEAPAPEGYAQA